VKVPADKPIRFALLDAKGAVVRQEHGWFWIRRGEQRYCVGCHAGPERSSENRVPAVLLRTTTPVDLTGAKAGRSAQSKRREAIEMMIRFLDFIGRGFHGAAQTVPSAPVRLRKRLEPFHGSALVSAAPLLTPQAAQSANAARAGDSL
jgi:hypothetical protein